jgi:hypothetical protein
MAKFRIKEVFDYTETREIIYDCDADDIEYHGDMPQNIKNKVVLSESVIGTNTDQNEIIYIVPFHEINLKQKKS